MFNAVKILPMGGQAILRFDHVPENIINHGLALIDCPTGNLSGIIHSVTVCLRRDL
jgi:hypothetical protein